MKKDTKPREIKDPNKKSTAEILIMVGALGYYLLEGHKIIDMFLPIKTFEGFYLIGLLMLLGLVFVGIQKLKEGLT